jgi:deoxyribonuclease-4
VELLLAGRAIILPMLYVGPAGYPPGSKGPIQAVEKVKAFGLNALEVQFGRQVNLTEEKAKAMGERARELGIVLSAHAPYYINFNTDDEAKAAKSREWVLKSVRVAHAFRGRIVVIHAASYMGRSPEAATRAVIRNLLLCRDAVIAEDLRPLLGLETMGKVGSWGTLEEIGQVMKEVEGVVPVLDFAHLHARGQGSLRSKEDFRKVLDEYTSIYDGNLHCHFSCIEYTDKGEKRHLLLERKEPDFSLLTDLVVKHNRDVTIISETPQPSADAARMMEMLQRS